MGTRAAALGQVIPDAKKEKVEKVNDVKVTQRGDLIWKKIGMIECWEPCERFSWILGSCFCVVFKATFKHTEYF